MVPCFCLRFFRGPVVRLREVPPWTVLASRASCALLDGGEMVTGWLLWRFDTGVQVGLRFHVVGPPYSTTDFLMPGVSLPFSSVIGILYI